MLESEVDYEEHQGKEHGDDHDQESCALQLVPGRPCNLLGEFHVGLFAIVNELSHLCI